MRGLEHRIPPPIVAACTAALMLAAAWALPMLEVDTPSSGLIALLVALAMLPLFIFYMNRFQIGPEERALEAGFGDEFVRYRRRVRRWL
jgi:protein-S-isoprenylcysteine O-methyltransferase Ste14